VTTDASRRVLAGPADTAAMAAETAAALPEGALLVLTGPLGAGKTTFVRALALALGSDAIVTSPTYTLVHEYPTPSGPLVHVDAYRLADGEALGSIGLDAYRDHARLVVVEWGEALLGVYADALHLALDRDGGQHGASWRRGPPPSPERWILGIDTATPWLSLALWSPSTGRVERRHSHLGRRLASEMMSELDTFLARSGVERRALVAIGVGVGPGSFTGVRIGVATALGLGRGLAVPVGAASTLEAIGLAGLEDGEHGWAVVDARRGAVHASRLVRRGDDIDVLEEAHRRARAELPAAARVLEDVAPDALHAARRAMVGDPPRPRYD
jgi:tRNA threonylcarbamoyladenosine biosynthesis protein TsaE